MQTEERNSAMKARIEHLKEGVADFNDTRDALKKVFLVTLFLLCCLLIIRLILIPFLGTSIAAGAMEVLPVGATMTIKLLWYSMQSKDTSL
jgi:hypothetical protein